jgi:hypothetical protein
MCVYGDQKLAAAFLPHSLVRCAAFILLAEAFCSFVRFFVDVVVVLWWRPASLERSSARRTLTRGELVVWCMRAQ